MVSSPWTEGSGPGASVDEQRGLSDEVVGRNGEVRGSRGVLEDAAGESARAQGAPVEFDVQAMQKAELTTVE